MKITKCLFYKKYEFEVSELRELQTQVPYFVSKGIFELMGIDVIKGIMNSKKKEENVKS